MRLEAAAAPEPGEEQTGHTVEPGDARAGGHEGIHVGRAVAQLAPGADEEGAARTEDDGGGKQAGDGAGEGVVHEEHAHDDQRNGQRQGQQGIAAQADEGLPAAVFGLGGGVGRRGRHEVVAAGAHGLAERLGGGDGGVVDHARRGGGEVDPGLFHARLAPQYLLYAGRAGRAAHFKNRKGAYVHGVVIFFEGDK